MNIYNHENRSQSTNESIFIPFVLNVLRLQKLETTDSPDMGMDSKLESMMSPVRSFFNS